jgi:protocatechuate 3,4-dioxygenase beta subunit
MKPDEGYLFSRATALGLLGGAVGILVGGTTTDAAGCGVTPKGEIGPFFADDSLAGFNRSSVLSNLDGTNPQAGIPLTLTVRVHDTRANCAAMSGVQLDLWHCNATGVYSDEASEGTSSETWLRGYRLTDAAGTATFTTIVPGWYPGRTTHIHLRARSRYNAASSARDGANTTQIFFPQATIDTIGKTAAAYRARGVNPTTNASDNVYTAQTKGQTDLVLRGNTITGFVATVAIGLPIT